MPASAESFGSAETLGWTEKFLTVFFYNAGFGSAKACLISGAPRRRRMNLIFFVESNTYLGINTINDFTLEQR